MLDIAPAIDLAEHRHEPRVRRVQPISELQLDALRRAGCEKVNTEKASGAKADRPELARVLDDVLRKGDVLVVWKLYHFHKPKDEAEANLWMRRALVTYNNRDHRSEPHRPVEDWLKHLPPSSVRDVLVGTVLRLRARA